MRSENDARPPRGPPAIRSSERAIEAGSRWGGDPPGFHKGPRRAFEVALDETGEKRAEAPANPRRQANDGAEIGGDDRAVVGEAQSLARGLGEERAVAQHLLEEGGDQVVQDPGGVETGGQDRVTLPNSGSRHMLAGQDPASGSFPVRLGHAERLVADEVVGDFRRRGRLEPEIDLRLQHFGDAVDGVLDPQSPPVGPAVREPADERAHQREVAHQRPVHAGAQDLDGERAAVGALSTMHLGEGPDGARRVVERREQRSERLVKLTRNRGPHFAPGHRGWPRARTVAGAERTKSQGFPISADEAAERGETRPCLGQGAGQRARGTRAAARSADEFREPDGPGRDPKPLERRQRVVARERSRQAQQSKSVAQTVHGRTSAY